MSVNLIFKIAAVGILVTVIGQILKHSGREEHASGRAYHCAVLDRSVYL